MVCGSCDVGAVNPLPTKTVVEMLWFTMGSNDAPHCTKIFLRLQLGITSLPTITLLVLLIRRAPKGVWHTRQHLKYWPDFLCGLCVIFLALSTRWEIQITLYYDDCSILLHFTKIRKMHVFDVKKTFKLSLVCVKTCMGTGCHMTSGHLVLVAIVIKSMQS